MSDIPDIKHTALVNHITETAKLNNTTVDEILDMIDEIGESLAAVFKPQSIEEAEAIAAAATMASCSLTKKWQKKPW